MSESTGGLAFITNLRISNKITAGFGLILLILTVSSVMAVTLLRGRVREYNFSDEEATADLAIKYAAALRQLIADGLTRVTNPERHALLENIGKQAALYTTGFEILHAKKLEQDKLQTGVLDVVGQQMTDGFTAVSAAVVKAGNTDLLPVALDARRLSLMARLDANKRLGRNDEAAAKSAEQRFADLKAIMTQLAAATEVTALLGAEAKLIDTYQSAFQRAIGLEVEQMTMMNGSLRQAGDSMAADAVKAKDSNLQGNRVKETRDKRLKC
jgi:methyl-accepting chemotaxis protein